jgi:hypothetical protein
MAVENIFTRQHFFGSLVNNLSRSRWDTHTMTAAFHAESSNISNRDGIQLIGTSITGNNIYIGGKALPHAVKNNDSAAVLVRRALN